MTFSSGLTPTRCRTICKAAMPLTVATAKAAPVKVATRSSNAVTWAPTEEAKLESMQSTSQRRSGPSNTGRCRGMGPRPYSARISAIRGAKGAVGSGREDVISITARVAPIAPVDSQGA